MTVFSNTRTLFASLLLTGALPLVGARLAPDVPPGATRLVFQPESTIRVEGTSTIHDWTCEASKVVGFVSGTMASGTLERIAQVEASVPVQALDCDNGTMNRKMRAALKVEDAPTIRYVVTEARLSSAPNSSGVEARVQGSLSMAGATRTVTASVDGERLGAGRYRFTGAVSLNMETFGIDPPTAMLGTLKTGEEVTVHVEIVAQSS